MREAGFERVFANLLGAHVAQSVEHFLGKEEVTGSIPVVGFEACKGRPSGATVRDRSGREER